MIIPEYGRHIQKMIDHATNIQDEKERNHCARSIIKVMGELNPHLRDVPDFNHKLWDHLFIMSNFKLEVDSPYEKPSPEVLNERPEMLDYLKYRHYGKITRQLVKKAIEFEDGKEKNALVGSIANLMKRSYLTWNNDSVSNEIIVNDLIEISEGKLKLPEGFEFEEVTDIIQRNQKRPQQRRKSSGQRQGNRNRRKN